MKRRSKAGGEQLKGPRRKAPEPKRRNAPKTVPRSKASPPGEETEVARLTRERDEALEQQTATGNVLKIISRPSFDLQAVLDTLVKLAARLCGADNGGVQMREGDVYPIRAHYGATPEAVQYALLHPLRADRSSTTGRVALEGTTIHIPDVLADPEYHATDYQRAFGSRTTLGVPLLRDGTTIGVFSLGRHEVKPFTDKQIKLVTTFADQALIAIENARLLNELWQRTTDLTEALERQTAASEVLQVISSSPGDLQSVFQAMLEKAVRICDAKFGSILRWDNEVAHLVAMHNAPPAFAEVRGRSQNPANPKTSFGRMVATKAVVHVADAAAEPGYVELHDPAAVAAVELGGQRTALYVPMLKETELIGAFTISRQEVRPFTDKQIGLVQNFAAQAVIAIENARLLSELRERTEEVEKLNKHLEQRVADQVGEIERMSRLRRFLPRQVADRLRFREATRKPSPRDYSALL